MIWGFMSIESWSQDEMVMSGTPWAGVGLDHAVRRASEKEGGRLEGVIGSRSQACPPAISDAASYSAFLSLHFLVCKMGIVTLSPAWSCLHS